MSCSLYFERAPDISFTKTFWQYETIKYELMWLVKCKISEKTGQYVYFADLQQQHHSFAELYQYLPDRTGESSSCWSICISR